MNNHFHFCMISEELAKIPHIPTCTLRSRMVTGLRQVGYVCRHPT